jgi:hypothetical protein
MKQCRVFSLLIFCMSPIQLTFAQTSTATASALPRLVRFGGTVKGPDGHPLAGVAGITFALYSEQTGGAPLWLETQNITADGNGRYTALLGATKPEGLPAELFTSEQAHWVGVQVQGQPEQPRVLLVSAPYALKAGDAETIGGLPPSAFVLAAPAIMGSAAAGSAAASTAEGVSPATVTDVTTTGGTADFLPIFSGAATVIDSVVFQTGTGATAKVGINTITPATTLDLNGAGTIRGTLSLPATGAATATVGKDSQGLNLVASSFSSTSSTALNQTFRWQAEPAANDTTAPLGTLNLLYGLGATTPAETGLKLSNKGVFTFATGQTFPGTGDGTITGVTAGTDLTGGGTTGTVTLNLNTTKVPLLASANTFTGNQTVTGTITASSSGDTIAGTTSGGAADSAVSGNATATSGTTFGVFGQASSPAGFGLYAINTATTGNAVGVYGQTASTSGVGVRGSANATTGTTYGVFGGSQSPAGYGLYATNTATTGNAVGVYGTTQSPTGIGVEGTNNVGGTGVFGAGTFGVTGTTSSPAGYGVQGTNNSTTGNAVGVYGTTNSVNGYGVVGLQGGAGVSSPQPAGVYGSSLASLGFGVEGVSPSFEGVYGTGLVGVSGETQATSGFGVWGEADSATGTTIGVYGQAYSPAGYGVYGGNSATAGYAVGVYGTTASTAGYGVQGASPNVGVYGVAAGSSQEGTTLVSKESGLWGDTGGGSGQAAVLGTADGNSAGAFYNNSPSPYETTLYAENDATTPGAAIFNGVMPGLGIGTPPDIIWPMAFIGDAICGAGFMALQLGQTGMADCINYTLMGDVYGDTYLNAASGGTMHLRVNNSSQLNVTAGNVDVLTTLTKPAGSFKIDHPLDPANKYLYHSFVESPDMMNIYNGNVTTDASGDAAVDLPEWFETLNRDFRYQLTVMGQFAQAIVAGKVANHQFRIKTDKPNVEVSWQVTGIRQDAFANAHRIQVEVEKAPADRGHYLYPELVGAPETARIGYMAVPPGSENVVRHPPTLPRRRNVSPSEQQTPLGNPVLGRPVPPSVAPPSVPKMPTPMKPPVMAAAQPVTVQPK